MQEPQEERRREDLAPEAKAGPDRRRIARIVVALAIVVLLLLFITGNSDPVDISFVFAEVDDVPLIIVAAASIVIGMVGGWLLGRERRRATKRYIRELERRIEERG
ncbi:MAG: LapA family protein [Actinomycetota bacterium]